MQGKLRRTGIKIIGDVPWGTHFCQFYKTKQDLLDILVPYFRAGLRNKEFCMWVTSEPLRESDVVKAMKKVLPGFDRYLKRGQIEIIPYTEWYVKGGKFNSKRVLDGWVDKLNQALAKGFEGLRLTGNTFWLEKKDWRKFTDYEEEVDSVIGKYKMIAMCTYSLEKCGANEVIDVVRNHQFALIKREEKWERIETAERDQMRGISRESETKYRIVADNTFDWEFWLNPEGRFQYVSPSCKRISGYLPEDFLLDPDLRPRIVHPDDAARFAAHVLNAEKKRNPSEMEFRIIRVDGTERWISHACQPVFDNEGVFLGTRGSNRDITKRKEAEEALRESNKRLEILSETSSRLLASDAPQQIVNDLCSKVMAHLDCHVFINYLVDEEQKRLHLNAFAGIPEKAGKEIEWLDYGVAVCGCAARDANRIVAENIPETLDPRTDLVRSFGIKAYACHPLFAQGRVIGTLSFGTRTRSNFKEDELDLMKSIADQVSLAMERIQNIHQLKAAQESLRRSRDMLEIRVQERTSDLKKANEELRAEIMERKVAEEKNREQADLLDLTHDAIIVRDMSDQIVFWNRGAEETYGWTKEEAVGNVTHVFLQTEFPTSLAEVTKDLLATDRWRGELVHSKKDGTRILVETRQALNRDKDGKPLGTLEISRDITKRKQAQEALRVASLYARSLLEASLDPLVTISAEGKIMDVNEATEKATGISREHLIGSDFSDYFTEPEKAREGYRRVFSEGSVRDYPLAVRHTSGRVTEVLYNAAVYRSEQGDVQGVFAAARDVTELRRAEESLRTYMTKLEWRNRELQDFAFVASHDLQEPLRKIQAFGDQLKSKYSGSLGDEGSDYLQRMHNAAIRMQALIQALLNYSRVTTKAEPFSAVDLKGLLREVVTDLEITIEKTGGRVEVEDLPNLEADPNQMRQLFQNLVSNALKFRREEKPVIRIYGRQTPPGDNLCQIFVEDNGIGFDEKYLDRIFVPFQRLHGRGIYEGTGIGLAICRKIIERHGGAITARSTPGKGSTFIVSLPLRQRKEGEA